VNLVFDCYFCPTKSVKNESLKDESVQNHQFSTNILKTIHDNTLALRILDNRDDKTGCVNNQLTEHNVSTISATIQAH
jgi:hypothetical protein